MTREEAYEYWRYKYEMAKDFDDPHWEGGEIREIRRYVDALATIVKMLEPPMTNYDRLISKTPEELAEWLADILNHCDNKNPEELCHMSCPLYKCCNDQPYDNIEDWLKAPVEEVDQ